MNYPSAPPIRASPTATGRSSTDTHDGEVSDAVFGGTRKRVAATEVSTRRVEDF
jgi:hypothetical protein